MPANLLRKLPVHRLGLTAAAEPLVRNILLVGFCLLLLLVGGLGYWSRESFLQVENEIALLKESEANHLRNVLRIEGTDGKMAAEARAASNAGQNRLLRFPAQQRLKQLKAEMDEYIEVGRKSSMASTEEWKDFEQAFQTYWAEINSDQPIDWFTERSRVSQAIDRMEEWTTLEREENDRKGQALSRVARNRVVLATWAAMFVGLVVAALTFYEIRRILARLGASYKESAESRDYLQSLFDSLVSGVVVIGQEGRVQTISDSFQKVMGLDEDEALGESYEKMLGDKPALTAAVSEHLEGGAAGSRYFGRYELVEARLFDVYASPLMIAEEQRGLILVFVEMTEVERAQSELRRNRALSAVGQMTAQIAHEIKNPLGSIRFATEVLKRRGGNTDDANETLEVIDRSVNHLAAIVTELSEFARPKELNRIETDLNNLLDDLMPMVADRLSVKEMKVKRDYAANLPTAPFDPTELRKLFLNLIINAIDASHPGGEVEVKTSVNGKGMVTVTVTDHGAGMDPETRRRLFEPFYTTKQAGTGLGMAIAKKIAELHRGDLAVASRLGEGTTVTVRLPVD
jgi:PAS domain S-box-containing protein